jgi:hypothetical protein
MIRILLWTLAGVVGSVIVIIVAVVIGVTLLLAYSRYLVCRKLKRGEIHGSFMMPGIWLANPTRDKIPPRVLKWLDKMFRWLKWSPQA